MRIFRLLFTLRRSVPRAFALFRHPSVPFWLKAATVGTALLAISPLDPLADIPVIGLFDDVALLALIANGFVMLADRMLLKTVMPVAPTARARPAAIVLGQ